VAIVFRNTINNQRTEGYVSLSPWQPVVRILSSVNKQLSNDNKLMAKHVLILDIIWHF